MHETTRLQIGWKMPVKSYFDVNAGLAWEVGAQRGLPICTQGVVGSTDGQTNHPVTKPEQLLGPD